MTDPRGFMKVERRLPARRPVAERLRDWNDVYLEPSPDTVRTQASRCMDCGIPFCQSGCPLGNLIPEWNDLVHRDQWRDALDRLHATNNFPEFTGKLCPAPCEASCVLSINAEPVTIKQIELAIIERGFEEGWVTARPPATRTGKRVAVVGSGPAGLAAAQQLNWAGHCVTVFERDDRIGGLLRYGIPDFKMDKTLLDRRLRLLEQEGVQFRTNAHVGVNLSAEELLTGYDALVLAIGAGRPRDLPIPGRDLDGIHFAMDYLPLQNRGIAGDIVPEDAFISARNKRVVIIGGGDTGADCLGTAHRQGAASVIQFEAMPMPPETRLPDNPWPEWPRVFRLSPAHEEGGVLEFAVLTKEFVGRQGKVEALRAARASVVRDGQGRTHLTELEGTGFVLEADLVLLAIGYLGPTAGDVVSELGLDLSERGTLATSPDGMTARPGIFAAGDAAHGQSLIVTAIAEGRRTAASVDRYLMGAAVAA
jgi:glutamate synthase (NADPH/NADH) small chain